jgi:hypothetical protein
MASPAAAEQDVLACAGVLVANSIGMQHPPGVALAFAASALALCACAPDAGALGETLSSAGCDPTGDAEEPATGQDTPVTLPHTAQFQMRSIRLLGHPFHLAYHAQVTVTASAQWEHRLCPIHSYSVTISETGLLPQELGFKTYPTGGTDHAERWEAPLDGEYRLEVIATDHSGCLPLKGTATITSP